MPRIEFDPAKDAANKIKHGLSFADFRGFDSPPQLVVDVRNNYGENRFRAFGRIEGVPHSVAFTHAKRRHASD